MNIVNISLKGCYSWSAILLISGLWSLPMSRGTWQFWNTIKAAFDQQYQQTTRQTDATMQTMGTLIGLYQRGPNTCFPANSICFNSIRLPKKIGPPPEVHTLGTYRPGRPWVVRSRGVGGDEMNRPFILLVMGKLLHHSPPDNVATNDGIEPSNYEDGLSAFLPNHCD